VPPANRRVLSLRRHALTGCPGWRSLDPNSATLRRLGGERTSHAPALLVIAKKELMFRAHAAYLLGSFTALDGTALEVGGRGQPLLVMLRAEAELELPLVASTLLTGVGFAQARISRLRSQLQVATHPAAGLVVVPPANSALDLSRSFALGHLAARPLSGAVPVAPGAFFSVPTKRSVCQRRCRPILGRYGHRLEPYLGR
jgi:hypothetical protein